MFPEWWDWQSFAAGVAIMVPVAAWLYNEFKKDMKDKWK